MSLDPTISLGALLSVIVTLFMSGVVGLGFIWAIKASVGVLDVRLAGHERAMDKMQEEVKMLGKLVSGVAVQDQRLTNIEERMLAQTLRFDEFNRRFNTWMDAQAASQHLRLP